MGRNERSKELRAEPSDASQGRSPDEAARRGRRVLVVEWRMPSRERFAGALEEAGFDVTTCPGPSGPGYECIGGRGLPCPLVFDADVVILDLRLESDEMGLGIPAWQLALTYRGAGKPLVVLSGESDPVSLIREPGVEILSRRPDPPTLVEAVRRVLAESSAPAAGPGTGDRA